MVIAVVDEIPDKSQLEGELARKQRGGFVSHVSLVQGIKEYFQLSFQPVEVSGHNTPIIDRLVVGIVLSPVSEGILNLLEVLNLIRLEIRTQNMLIVVVCQIN